MPKYGSYLVCKGYIQEVRDFLGQFFEEERGRYNHEGWITFKTPEGFLINLMRGADQEMTQNMTFEIYCDSMEELEEYSKRFNTKVENFVVTETDPNYRYHYVEILGPQKICKIEVSYSENIKN